ncbi:MAG: 4-aminobutyrate aminotransferase [Parcubacteria group bacterium Gr01-1014_3]|nr:MAG: 4-aminobutyrate aminotransferase [Parcubacteria group bacterium Gr01-1014_3]
MNTDKERAAKLFSRVEKIPREKREDSYACTTVIDKKLTYLDGKGSRIMVLDNGQRRSLIDASGGVSTKNLGYGNERIRQVIREVLRKQKDVFGYPHHDMQNDYALELAYVLAELTPLKVEREVVFANSGSEGIEAAIKLCYNARVRTGTQKHRKDFVACYGAFHGRTLGALSLTCSKPIQRENYPTNAFPNYHIHFPAKHRYFVYDDDGDVQYTDLTRNEYLEKLKTACRKGMIDIDSVNAVVLELIQGEGGINVPSKEAIQDLVRFFKNHGVYVVVDEIQTGLGRTGKLFAFEHFNIEPDVVVLSKSLAHGFPFSAVIYDHKMGWTNKGQQSSTFAGSPLGSAIALEVLSQTLSKNLPQRAQEVGDGELGPALRMIEEENKDVVHNVRGMGLMHGIEFWNPNTIKPATNFRNEVVLESRKRGVLFLDAGISAIRITPPLIIGSDSENKRKNELGIITDTLKESIRAVKRKMKRIN